MKTRLYSEGKCWFEKWYTRTYAVPSRNKQGFRLVKVKTIMELEVIKRDVKADSGGKGEGGGRS